MKGIVLKVRWSVKERLRKNLRQVRNAGTKVRYLMIFLSCRDGRATKPARC